MKLIKALTLISFLIISSSVFALTPISGDASLGIIKDGVTLEIRELVSSKEGESTTESVIQYGSFAPKITFYKTGGRKVTLRIGTQFTLRNVQFSKGEEFMHITAELTSSNPTINSYTPTAKFIIRASTIQQLREEANNQIELYYAPGDDDEIIL